MNVSADPETCRARKVKCDEARPHCSRCQKSGQNCAGYRDPPVGSLSWSRLLRTRPSILPSSTATSDDLRGLDFFRYIVAPALAGPAKRAFWTESVLQMAIQETSTCRAVLAISSLYEHFGDVERRECTAPDRRSEAVKNYNQALREIYLSKNLSTDVVIFASVLFICIEFLHGNINAAIDHCRHGTRMINRYGSGSEISGLFRHLSIFPHFFGATIVDFPSLSELQGPTSAFSNLAEAQETMDWLMSRCVRLIRTFDVYRMDITGDLVVPSDLSYAQWALCQDLTAWMGSFDRLRSPLKLDADEEALVRLLEMRWQVCHIWAEITSCQDEIVCDAYLGQFSRIVDLAEEEVASRSPLGPPNLTSFSFEMGMAPLLHFVVVKCRYLRLRLRALWQLRLLAKPRESMWDSAIMYAQGIRFIEYEHGIQLTTTFSENMYQEHDLPSEAQRIRDSQLDERRFEGTDSEGNRVTFQGICLFLRSVTEPRIRQVDDWVIIRKEMRAVGLDSNWRQRGEL